MHKFWSVIKYILMFFGVLFLLEVIAVIYLVVADPLGIGELMSPPAANEMTEQMPAGSGSTAPTGSQATDTTTTDKHPALSESQEQALESIGVDPATLPTEITPEQEDCMRKAVGEERAAEIEAGAEPTFFDYLKAKDCL